MKIKTSSGVICTLGPALANVQGEDLEAVVAAAEKNGQAGVDRIEAEFEKRMKDNEEQQLRKREQATAERLKALQEKQDAQAKSRSDALKEVMAQDKASSKSPPPKSPTKQEEGGKS